MALGAGVKVMSIDSPAGRKQRPDESGKIEFCR